MKAWNIEQQPQSQKDLTDQLRHLHVAAARLGLYDAADWLWKNGPLQSSPPAKSLKPFTKPIHRTS